MRTSFLNASWRAASLALAAFLSMVSGVQAAPMVNMYFSPASVQLGSTSLLVISVSDDLNAGFSGGSMSMTYPAGLVNASSSVVYDSCGSTVATPGTGSVSSSGMGLGAFGTCYIEINITASSAGSYTVVFPTGGMTASTGSNSASASATLDVIAPAVVTTTADSGAGSLRQAILDTNASCASGSSIAFNIPGAAPYTIQPLTALDPITCNYLMLDAYTQAGAARNTDTTGGNNAAIMVVLDGSMCPGGCTGLSVSASYVVISGLAIHSFGGVAIQLNDSAYVYGNYLGTDPGGMTALPNLKGVNANAGYSYIGSSSPGDRNLISGNSSAGIMFWTSSSGAVENNQIGGRRDGSAGMPNATGVYFNGVNYSRAYVQHNYIRYNTAQGVVVDDATVSPVIFLLNAMSGNGGIGIDLNNDGPTPNDETGPPYDSDGGPNGLANYPVITSVTHSGSDTIVQGYVKSTANAYVDVQLFDNPTLPSNTEGAVPLMVLTIHLDSTGYATFSQTVPGYLASYVSAAGTTDDCGDGCVVSSEYSPAVGVTTVLSCQMYVQIAAVGDGGVIGAPSVIAPPGASTMIQPLCGAGPYSYLWNTTQTTQAITVNAPAAGATATYTVTVTGGGATGTVTVDLVGAAIGTPVCTLNTSVTLPMDPLDTSPFNVISSCSPPATGFTWDTGLVSLVSGQGTSTATYQVVTPQPGVGYTVSLVPTNVAGTGATATRIIWSSPVHIDTKPLAFPTTAVGSQSAVQSVTVQNLSNYFTPYLSVIATGPFVVTNNCAYPVPTLTNCALDIQFAPTVAGAGQTGTLTVSFGFPGNPSYTIALSGDATGTPVVTLTPGSLTFSSRPIGTPSASQPVTLTNNGTAGLTITSISATGDFSQVNTCPTSPAILAAGTFCTIDVTFTPTANGARSGTLSVASNAGGSPHTVGLSGTGVTPAPVASITPTSLSFAARTVSTTSTAQTITLANTGTLALAIASVGITGDFAFTSGCGTTLAPGASCTIDVTFTPLAVAPRSGTLTITDNAPGNPHTVALTGTGLSNAVPVADLSPPGVNFSAQPIGSDSAPEVMTVTNSGNAPLTFTSIDVSGEFALVPAPSGDTALQCPITLAPGSSCEIHVIFRPIGPNLRQGAVRLVTNAGVVTAGLVGTGYVAAPPQLSLASSLAFGSQPIGTRSAGTRLAIRNTSEVLATITTLSATGDFDVSDTCTTIVSGGTCSPLVTFQPTALGPRTGTLTITTLRDVAPYIVSLTGTGEENRLPVLELSATSMGFGNSLMGVPVAHDVTVRNAGTAPLTITSILAGGSFFTDTGCITTLPAGSTCTIHVMFAASLPGAQSAILEIASNAAGSPHRVGLSGTGCFVPTPSRVRLGGLLCGP